jgi:hypothetical protein
MARNVEATVPAERKDEKAKRIWLREHHLSGSWQADAGQLLALLAPVLSAPVFDTPVKT